MFNQILQLWNQLTLRQRASIGVSFALVVIGMGVLLAWSSRPEMRLLYSGMETEDMAELVGALDEKGTAYTIGNDGRSLYVAAEEVHRARLELASKGLPKGGAVGYEIFDRNNFGISSFAQHTNFIRALQGELARTIMQVDGVRSARVLVVIPENRMLVEGRETRPTASVFVDTRGSLGETEVRAIRHLVANAVEGLTPNQVAVVDQLGRLLSDTGEEEDPLASPTGTLKYRASLESYYTRKVEGLLATVVGPENVVARVSVDVELDSSTRTENSFDPETPVVREQTVTESKNFSTESRDTVAVGAASNTGEEAKTNPSADNSTQEQQVEKTTTYEISETRTETLVRPGGIRQIGAAVFLAQRFVTGENGEKEPQTRSADELAMIQQMVRHALGTTKGGEPAEVTVVEVPFNGQGKETTEPLIELPRDADFWVRQIRFLATLLVALFMFVVLLRMLKKQHHQLAGIEILEPEETGTRNERGGFIGGGQLTPEFLNALITEKPENVSTALKNWVTHTTKAES